MKGLEVEESEFSRKRDQQPSQVPDIRCYKNLCCNSKVGNSFKAVIDAQLGFLTLCRVKIMLYFPNTCLSLITWCGRW